MKKFISIILAMLLMTTSIIVPFSALANTDISGYSKYVYDSNNDPIDYNKIAVFESKEDLNNYIKQIDLRVNNTPELLDGLVCYFKKTFASIKYDRFDDEGKRIDWFEYMHYTDDYSGPYQIIAHVIGKPNKDGLVYAQLVQLEVKKGYSDDKIEGYYKTVHRAIKEMDLDGKSDYVKVESILHWVIHNIDYQSYNIINGGVGTLITQSGVCANYADLVNYFCKMFGIESYECSSGQIRHAWNLIKINDIYYFADATLYTYLTPLKDLGKSCSDMYINNHYGTFTLTRNAPYIELNSNEESAKFKDDEFVKDVLENTLISGDVVTGYMLRILKPQYKISSTCLKKASNDELQTGSEFNLPVREYETDQYVELPTSGRSEYNHGYYINTEAYYADNDVVIQNERKVNDCILNGYSGDKVVPLTENTYKVDKVGRPTTKEITLKENRVIENGEIIKNTKGSHNYYKKVIKNHNCPNDVVTEYVCKDCGTTFHLTETCSNHKNISYIEITPNTCDTEGNAELFDENLWGYDYHSSNVDDINVSKLNHNLKTETLDNGTLERTYCTNTSNTISVTGSAILNNINEMRFRYNDVSRCWTVGAKNLNCQMPTLTLKCLSSKIKYSYFGEYSPNNSFTFLMYDKNNEISKEYYISYVKADKAYELVNVKDTNDIIPIDIKNQGLYVIYTIKANGISMGFSPSEYKLTDFINSDSYVNFTYDNVCDYETTKELDHYYQETNRVNSTCIKNGTVEYTCKHCGNIKYDTLPLSEHKLTTKNEKSSTCSEEGYTGDKVCTVCNQVIEKGSAVPKKDHTYKITTVNANCTSQGYDEYTCIYCGYSYKTNITEPNGNHVPQYGVNKVDATCTSDGYTGDTVCSVCHKVIQKGSVVEKKNHSYTLTTIPATCISEGYDLYTCTNCNDSYKDNIVPKNNNHTIVVDNAVSATCTEDGLTSGRHCSACGKVLSAQKVIKATGHKVVTIASIPATCTTTGLTEGSKCSVCGTVLVEQQVVPKTAHTWDEGVITKASTCTAEGVKTYHCTNCDATKTESVAKIWHSFGNNQPTCSVCGTANPNYVAPVQPTEPATQPTQPSQAPTQPSVTPTTPAATTPVPVPTQPTTTAVTKPKSTKIKKLKGSKKAIAVTWSKVSSINGYEIQLATDKKFKKNKKTVSIKKQKTTSNTVKKLKAKTKYYVRIRTYKVVNGKKVYSSWSCVKSVKTK